VEFRRAALAKLEGPEDLDLPVRLTSPRTWLVLVATALVVLGFGTWAYAGSLPRELTAAGILMYPHGGFRLESTLSGMVTQLLVEPGTTVAAGTPVAHVIVDGRTEVVPAGAAGKVTDVLVRPGQAVTTGAALAMAERATDGDHLVAVLYLSSAHAAEVTVGASVDLAVSSVPPRTFGTLRGTVQYRDAAPEDRDQVSAFLGDDTLTDRFTAAGPPIKVVVRLDPAATPSGYQWSTRAGPPFPLACRTLVSASVHLRAMHPVDLVLPR
jgi:Biotin-requiring enzyme